MKIHRSIVDWRRPAQITVLAMALIFVVIPLATSLAWIFNLWAPVPPIGKLPQAIAVLQLSASGFAVARTVIQSRRESDDDSLR